MDADGHGLSPCFIKLRVVQLCILCVAMQITSYMKAKGSMYNVHLDFRGKICEKKVCIIYMGTCKLYINHYI